MNYWCTQHKWISKALCWVKEVSVRKLRAIWLYLNDILEKAKLYEQRTDQWLPGSENLEKAWLQKGSKREFFRVVELFSILIVEIVTWVYSGFILLIWFFILVLKLKEFYIKNTLINLHTHMHIIYMYTYICIHTQIYFAYADGLCLGICICQNSLTLKMSVNNYT